MKNKMTLVYIGLALLIIVTGVVVYKAVMAPPPTEVEDVVDSGILPPVDAAVIVTLEKAAKPNSVTLRVAGLGGKYASIGYEFSYESKGLIKGVNSGSKPIEVSGQDTFDREVYLGTCSRNVCTPDAGVTMLSVVLQFTDASGKQSQFSKDFEL